eukprot:9457730-Alexandrium_andersonii.AAC.1
MNGKQQQQVTPWSTWAPARCADIKGLSRLRACGMEPAGSLFRDLGPLKPRCADGFEIYT